MELKTNDYKDNELLYLVSEKNEDASNILFDKYKHIVDITIGKYIRSAYALKVDIDELYQEAMVGYADAIRSYNESMETQLPSFISLCVERRVSNFIKKNNTTKFKMLKDAYSFDNEIGEDLTLADVVGDNSTNPEVIKEQRDSIRKIRETIDKKLSQSEKEVLELLLNDFSNEDIAGILGIGVKNVYNYTSRIRAKLKDLI